MTQAQLARTAGVSERNVVRWENDQHSPRLEHLIAVSRATSTPLEELYGDEEEESSLAVGREQEFLDALRPLARLLADTAERAA